MRKLIVVLVVLGVLGMLTGCSMKRRYVGRGFHVPYDGSFATVVRNSMDTVHSKAKLKNFTFTYAVESLGNDEYLLNGDADFEHTGGADRFMSTDVVFILVRNSRVVDSVSFQLRGQSVEHTKFSKKFRSEEETFFIGPGRWSYSAAG